MVRRGRIPAAAGLSRPPSWSSSADEAGPGRAGRAVRGERARAGGGDATGDREPETGSAVTIGRAGSPRKERVEEGNPQVGGDLPAVAELDDEARHLTVHADGRLTQPWSAALYCSSVTGLETPQALHGGRQRLHEPTADAVRPVPGADRPKILPSRSRGNAQCNRALRTRSRRLPAAAPGRSIHRARAGQVTTLLRTTARTDTCSTPTPTRWTPSGSPRR
jgi:hypothetical protein